MGNGWLGLVLFILCAVASFEWHMSVDYLERKEQSIEAKLEESIERTESGNGSRQAALTLLDSLVTSGTQAPVIEPSEVQTRIVHRLRVNTRPGVLRYRIPAQGRFVVGLQRIKPNNQWSKALKLKGTRAGRTWYALAVPAGVKVRVVAVRTTATDKNAPVWVSPTTRTRSAR